MANGVQLATAYISLNVRTDDIKKQVTSALGSVSGQGRQVGQSIGSKIAEGIRSHLGGGLAMSLFNPMEIAGVRWAVKAGASIGRALKTAIAGAIGGLGLGAIFGVGGVLTAGLDRLKTMQQSTVQLSLKLKPDEIKRLQSEVRAAVEGTPISLDKAMQAVPKAISAGMNSAEVKQLITDLANLTASTGGQASFEQLAVIMDQVRSKTKLTGEEMQQLVDAGVDVRGMLKEAFGWDDKTLQNNLAKGKVGANELQKAIQKVYGSVQNADGSRGLAKRMGETFDGAIGNLKASAARLGANFIAALLGKKADEDPLKDFALGIGNITDALNSMGKWVETHREDIHNVFVTARDGVSKFIGGVRDTIDWLKRMWSTAQEVGDNIGSAFDKGKTAVTNLWNSASSTFDKIKTKVSDIFDDLKKKFESVFGPEGWFAKQFDKLGKIVDKVREVLGLGEATANADASSAPFNRGPMAPGAAPGGAGAGGGALSGRFGGPASSVLPGGVPSQSLTGAPIYNGPKTEDTGGAVHPRTAAAEHLIQQLFPGVKIGNDYRPQDGFNEHSSGEAADFMVSELGQNTPEGKKLGDEINRYMLDHAKELGLQYTIWQGKEWYPDGSTRPNGGQGVTGGHFDHVHGRFEPGQVPQAVPAPQQDSMQGTLPLQPPVDPLAKEWLIPNTINAFGSGGRVWGAGNGTSDSIPAMLSNGEHVLTADDVSKMGGQQGVYAFRAALKNGSIPGFAPGGAVDPSVVSDAEKNIADLNNAYEVAQARQRELFEKGDASESELLRAGQDVSKTKRALDNAAADLPIIAGGGTPPDRSKQDRVYDITDQLSLLQQQLKEQQEAGGEIPYSQQLQQNYQLQSLQKEREAAIGELTGQGQASDYGMDFVRSLGLIPASAGSNVKSGTSSLAGFIDMGASVVNGVIDTGVNLANTAVSAAIAAGAAAGSFGAGAAAAPAAQMAASYGLQLLGNQGKTISNYWFGLAGIGADAALEIFSPFGIPRALGYDYAGMTPQLGVQQAALGTLEQMGTDAINKQFANNGQAPDVPGVATPPPSGPAAGGQMTMTAPGAVGKAQAGGSSPLDSSGSFNMDLFNPSLDPNNPFGGGAGGGNGGGGSWARGGHVGIYDNGGVLKPGQLAFNASRTPESILTKQQWNAMAANASTKSKDSAPLVQNLYAQDMQDAIRQLEKVKRRDMMQYAGRG